MATSTESQKGGVVVQSWLPRSLAHELKQHAEGERRSLSSVVRLAIEDKLKERRP